MAAETWVAPFMNQSTGCPVTSFCHNRSTLPSPLKSPVPRSFQFGSANGVELSQAARCMMTPSMYQTAACPVVGLLQMRSGWPSPSISRTDTSSHALSTLVGENQAAEN